MLEEEGYTAFVSPSGAEALDLLKTIPPPNVILVDYSLPRMSGDEFLTLLEETLPETFRQSFLVGFSSFSTVSPLLKNFIPRVHLFTGKPNDIDEFLNLVRRCVD